MTDITQEIEEANRVNGRRWVILIYMNVLNTSVMIIFSFYVFIRIRFYHKRKDYFFTLIPSLMIISAVFYIPPIIRVFKGEIVAANVGEIDNIRIVIVLVANLMPTILFSTQYLKTSVIFPKLVTVTKIERLQSKTSADSTLGI